MLFVCCPFPVASHFHFIHRNPIWKTSTLTSVIVTQRSRPRIHGDACFLELFWTLGALKLAVDTVEQQERASRPEILTWGPLHWELILLTYILIYSAGCVTVNSHFQAASCGHHTHLVQGESAAWRERHPGSVLETWKQSGLGSEKNPGSAVKGRRHSDPKPVLPQISKDALKQLLDHSLFTRRKQKISCLSQLLCWTNKMHRSRVSIFYLMLKNVSLFLSPM